LTTIAPNIRNATAWVTLAEKDIEKLHQVLLENRHLSRPIMDIINTIKMADANALTNLREAESMAGGSFVGGEEGGPSGTIWDRVTKK
jgi:hypothetical protein